MKNFLKKFFSPFGRPQFQFRIVPERYMQAERLAKFNVNFLDDREVTAIQAIRNS